jgi:DNA ligase-associated metallophosphoesterase
MPNDDPETDASTNPVHAMGRSGCVELNVRDERLLLLPTRAVYWPRRQTLIIADTHLGKSSALRHAGVPVPPGTTSDDLTRLTESIRRTGARRVLLLGDLLHCRSGMQPNMLEKVQTWRRAHEDIRLDLVRGNHDRHAGDPPSEWRIAAKDEPVFEAPFVFRHTPAPADQGFVLAGHVHPLVRLNGKGAQRLRLPCFHFSNDVGILPAFSNFTSGAEIRPESGDRVYVVADGEIVEAPM